MLEFLSSIVTALGSILAVVFQFLLGITQLFAMIPDAITMVNTAIASMPLPLTAFATGMVSVSLVYLIIGRS